MNGDLVSADNKNIKNSASNFISLGKDSIALLRDFALFVLAVLLLLFPGTLNNVLTKAGFEEGSLVGFKWKAKLVESDTALKDAQALINDLQLQLDLTTQALAGTQSKLNDPSFKEKLTKLEEENRNLKATSSRVGESVADTIASNAPLVEKAQNAVSTNTSWGVVFGGDATLDKAKHEIEVTAPNLGIPNASIYHRQGSYRSVSVVESKTRADEVLAKARQKRRDAYIVNMSTWCPNGIRSNGYQECTGN